MGTRSKRRRQSLTARPGAGGLLRDPRAREGPPRGTAPPRAPPGPSRALETGAQDLLETGAQDLLLLFGPRRGRSEGRHGWCPPRGAGVRLSLLYFVIKTKANEVSPAFGSRRPPAKRHLGEAQQPSGTAGQPGESPPLRFPPPGGSLHLLQPPGGLVALPQGLSHPLGASPAPCHLRATKTSFSIQVSGFPGGRTVPQDPPPKGSLAAPGRSIPAAAPF